jgi:hypothetical protein
VTLDTDASTSRPPITAATTRPANGTTIGSPPDHQPRRIHGPSPARGFL